MDGYITVEFDSLIWWDFLTAKFVFATHIPRCFLYLSGWWLGTFFLFFHILGIIIPTDFHIFQRGWNYQPVMGFTIYTPHKELSFPPASQPDVPFQGRSAASVGAPCGAPRCCSKRPWSSRGNGRWIWRGSTTLGASWAGTGWYWRTVCELENGHRNSGLIHESWWIFP